MEFLMYLRAVHGFGVWVIRHHWVLYRGPVIICEADSQEDLEAQVQHHPLLADYRGHWRLWYERIVAGEDAANIRRRKL